MRYATFSVVEIISWKNSFHFLLPFTDKYKSKSYSYKENGKGKESYLRIFLKQWDGK